MSSPPITMAATIASTVTTTELPWMIASSTARLRVSWGWSPSPGAASVTVAASVAGPGSVGGLGSVIRVPVLVLVLRVLGFVGGFIIGARTGHQQAKLLHRHRGRADAGDPPFVHDHDAVGQRVDLVEFGGDDQHGHPLVPFGHDAAVHELDGAYVQAAGRLAGHEELQLAADLAGQDDLL